MSEVYTLQEAADVLGVHYMTAYRYVRTGMLEASKPQGTWVVTGEAIEQFRTGGATGPAQGRGTAPWSERLELRVLAGDSRGAWAVVESAMTAGTELDRVYLDILTPAMERIGERWARGELDVAIEHRASGLAMRIVGRLGHRFVRRGRSRGTIVIGAPAGEFHALPTAILGDLLRLQGWEVSDLGADVPSASFVFAVRNDPEVVAVGLSVTAVENLEEVRDVAAAISEATPHVLLVAGGRAIDGDDHARELGVHAVARGGVEMDALVAAHVAEPDQVAGE